MFDKKIELEETHYGILFETLSYFLHIVIGAGNILELQLEGIKLPGQLFQFVGSSDPDITSYPFQLQLTTY